MGISRRGERSVSKIVLLRCLTVIAVAASTRSLQSQAATEIDYFDRLRVDPDLLQFAQESKNQSNVFRVVDKNGDEYRLADVSTFLPFSDGTRARAGVTSMAIGALLAIYHFNNPEEGILDVPRLQGCNVRLTAEFFDTQFSPVESTRLITNVLRRNHSLETPLPTCVVGAYRSATTSPLAIITGVNEIPQVSYAATSSDFEVKEQYPLFGRTIPSSAGEAKVAVDYYTTLGATHVAILFVTDSFGSSLQKAFQDAAAEVGIVTSSVAFSYSADANGDEIASAVNSVASTQYRYIYAICFEQHYDPIMMTAHKKGITGGGYLWVFPGFDGSQFQSKAKYPGDSPLAMATRGIMLLHPSGGFLPQVLHPGAKQVFPLERNPTSGYQKLRTKWREALADPDFDDYVRAKVPQSVLEKEGYDHEAQFEIEPTQQTPLVYDAVMALGMSMCLAGTDAEFFTGPEIFNYFRNLTISGTSGNVDITPETGTRNYTTFTYVAWNVDIGALDEEGRVQYQLAPTSYYEDGKWKNVEGMSFIYGDGGTKAPDSLPPVSVDMNYIGRAAQITGYTLMGVVMGLAIASLVWLLWFRNHKVVSSAQPLFLLMVSFGTFVMASTIVPMSLQEPVPDSGLDAACMATPWIYVTGVVIAFSPLFAKTRGILMAYKNPEVEFIRVTFLDIFMTLAIVCSLNFVVLLTWTLVAPLEWTRSFQRSTDIFDRYVSSYGSCTNDDALAYVVVLVVLNVGFLLLANWWAFLSRNIETDYGESRYIGISMASVLQAWCMGVPIAIVVWDNPTAKFFVNAGIVFVTALAVLLLVYTPKVLAIRADLKRRRQHKRPSRRSDMFDEDDFCDDNLGMATKNSGDNSGCSDEGEPTKSPNDSSNTSGTTSSETRKTNCREWEDEATAAEPAIAVEDASSPPVLSDNMERKGGIRVLHNPKSTQKLMLSQRQACLREGDDAGQNDELSVHSEGDESDGSDVGDERAEDDLESKERGREQESVPNGEDAGEK